MSPEWVKNFAFARMPKIDAQVVSGTHRHDVIRTLTGANNIGIELGSHRASSPNACYGQASSHGTSA
jgi:hypothetical protein